MADTPNLQLLLVRDLSNGRRKVEDGPHGGQHPLGRCSHGTL